MPIKTKKLIKKIKNKTSNKYSKTKHSKTKHSKNKYSKTKHSKNKYSKNKYSKNKKSNGGWFSFFGNKPENKKSEPITSENEYCKKKFCKDVFLPEKERVEMKASKYYEPIEVLRKKNDDFERETADILENGYLESCYQIYCDKECKNSPEKIKTWLKSFSKERKQKLIDQGAISGCRDLIKEYPDYYENI
jgi:hypothetical protein